MLPEALASHRHCIERIRAAWPQFAAKRQERLREQERYGAAAEKVAESILEDLFSEVLDWSLGEINHQVEYADLVLTRQGIKQLVIEVKRPGALAWDRRAVEAALCQVRRYADEQRVTRVAVSDGYMLYAADIEDGGLHDRVFIDLGAPEVREAHEALWWLSVQGIYRPCREVGEAAPRLLPEPAADEAVSQAERATELLHAKYKIPVSSFGYAGDAADPKTWKPPFRMADGAIDHKRLPKAIQAILSNYRGTQVAGIPEAAIPDVLVRLALGATQVGKMPHQTADTPDVYRALASALEQLGRLEEVTGSRLPK